MGDNKRRYVIPGEVITTGPYRPEQNVILQDKKIIATKVGISEIYDDAVKVIPLSGMYIPKSQDLVIGKIVSHSSLSWEADINSCYRGMLPASDVFGRNFQPDSEELTSKLAKGDLIAARILNFDRSRDPLITIADREDTFAGQTVIEVGLLHAGDTAAAAGDFIAYLTKGGGTASGTAVADGDLLRGSDLQFTADEDVQLIVIRLL